MHNRQFAQPGGMSRWGEVGPLGLMPTLPALGAPGTCSRLPPATCCWEERHFSALGSPATSATLARIRGGHPQGGSIFAGEHLHLCAEHILTFTIEVWFWPPQCSVSQTRHVKPIQSYSSVAFLSFKLSFFNNAMSLACQTINCINRDSGVKFILFLLL